MTFDDMQNLMEKRRSIRYFSEKPLERAAIDKLIGVARLAPSVENTQPWHFYVITNPTMKAELMKHTCYGNFVAGAGAFIVVTCNRKLVMQPSAPIWNPKELEYSCIAAMDNIMIAATAMGIGSCWVSLHHGAVHNILKLKDYMTVVGGLMLGNVKEGEQEPSGHHERRPVSDLVTYHE